jgi:multiple sugar transport system substrate-binding protein
MADFTRRDVLKTGAGLAAAGALGTSGLVRPAYAQDLSYTPESGATLRVLRWAKFVQGDETQWLANTKAFSDKYGVPVRVDSEGWEDIRPKAAVAANVGSGPDIVLVWFDDAQLYPDKLLDVTELANYLGNKYGGWYEGLQGYAQRDGKFIGLPLAAIGNAICYRESWVKQAGFSEFPKDTDGFLALCRKLKEIGHPAGFTLGNAVGDGNNFGHWIMWSHGGKMVDEQGNVVINSPETIAGLKYAAELYKTFIPGTEAWLDSNNNRAFLSGEVSLTANGVSLYYAAKNDANLKEMSKDIRCVQLPVGPVGKPVELCQTTSAIVFNYTKYPNAAKEYLRFMWEKEQFFPWMEAASGYCCQPLKGYADHPIWKADPNHAAYAGASARLRPNGYAGPLGYASAAAMADYIVVNMVAEAATGQRTPEEAAARAQKRAERYYRV